MTKNKILKALKIARFGGIFVVVVLFSKYKMFKGGLGPYPPFVLINFCQERLQTGRREVVKEFESLHLQ